mmetsp:Transcript_50122/g.82616  ORF Transcript_50122/g.82616 Transcript_50122/m.82616 type:complete len:98 (+) Transcript_50122:520-813(+)
MQPQQSTYASTKAQANTLVQERMLSVPHACCRRTTGVLRKCSPAVALEIGESSGVAPALLLGQQGRSRRSPSPKPRAGARIYMVLRCSLADDCMRYL